MTFETTDIRSFIRMFLSSFELLITPDNTGWRFSIATFSTGLLWQKVTPSFLLWDFFATPFAASVMWPWSRYSCYMNSDKSSPFIYRDSDNPHKLSENIYPSVETLIIDTLFFLWETSWPLWSLKFLKNIPIELIRS